MSPILKQEADPCLLLIVYINFSIHNVECIIVLLGCLEWSAANERLLPVGCTSLLILWESVYSLPCNGVSCLHSKP